MCRRRRTAARRLARPDRACAHRRLGRALEGQPCAALAEIRTRAAGRRGNRRDRGTRRRADRPAVRRTRPLRDRSGNGRRGIVGLDVMTNDKLNSSSRPGSTGDSQTGSGEAGKTLLVGILGGLVSAAGYLVYKRLPDEQKERINKQVRSTIESRLSEIRQNFNI